MGLPGLRILDQYLEEPQTRKKLRYAGVSVVFVPLGQIIVQLLHWMYESWPNYLSILVTAGVLTIPNYFANKIFVWRDNSRDGLKTQMTVFWIAAMLGTGFAMGLATLADHLTADASKVWQAIWLFIAQLAGYGLVWVGRFIFLDRLIFKVTHHGEEPSEDDLEQMHADFPV